MTTCPCWNFLMLATARPSRQKPVLLQDELFELLIEFGLGHISLTPVKLLSDAEKAVVTLTAACMSESLLIVLNLPELEFDEPLINALHMLSGKARADGKTLVFGTNDGHIVEQACSHAVLISAGVVLFSGAVDELRRRYDPVELIIRGGQLELLAQRLTTLPAGCSPELREDALLITNRGAPLPGGLLHELILKTGIIPETIKVNPKTVKNAYEELLNRHDLQAELL